MDGPLVFVSCGVTTAPLIPLLAERFTPLVPYPDTVAQLERRGIRAVEWGAFVDTALEAQVAAAAPRLAAAWYARLEERADELFTFAGRRHGTEFLPAVDAAVRRHLAEQLHAFELGRVLGRSGRLAAVVTHEDVTGVIRAFLAGVRDRGVPAVHVPHGVYAEDAVVGADLHGVAHTDLIAVGGPAQREWFLRRGVPADRIVVTGNPAWDALCSPSPRPRSVLKLGGGPVVTVASSWIGGSNSYRAFVRHDQDRRLRACLRAVAARQAADPSVSLVVKLHPSAPPEAEDQLRAVAVECGARPDLVARDRLAEILAASDVLMTLPSTVAIEALLIGTPVIAVDCAYEGDAVMSAPADPGALEALLGRALAGLRSSPEFATSRQRFLARYNGPCDGGAGRRIVGLIEALATRAPIRGQDDDLDAACVGRRLASARARVGAGDISGALGLIEPALADGAASTDARQALWTLHGEVLARAGHAAEAESSFRQALALGSWGPAYAGLGLLFLERGARGAAQSELERAVELDPACDAAWAGLGVLAALNQYVPEAIRLLRRALAFNPENVEALSALDALGGRPVRPQEESHGLG